MRCLLTKAAGTVRLLELLEAVDLNAISLPDAIERGDTHFNGKFVKKMASTLEFDYYLKPRSTRLEGLLLNKESPIHYLLESAGLPLLGDVKENHLWEGTSKCLRRFTTRCGHEDRDNSKDYSHSSGRLLALATFLGIGDLHNENILIIEHNQKLLPYPVDIEITFWKCLSGMDTLLIPSRLISSHKCGLTGQFSYPFCPIGPEHLLDGFLEWFKENAKNISHFIKDLYQCMKGHPIRVLLRSTNEYKNYLKSSFSTQNLLKSNFIPSELEQLDNNDIPYFFFFRGEDVVKYFDKFGNIKTAGQSFSEKIKNLAINSIEELTDSDRMFRVLKITSMQILKNYFPSSRNQLLGTQFYAYKKDSSCYLETEFFSSKIMIK